MSESKQELFAAFKSGFDHAYNDAGLDEADILDRFDEWWARRTAASPSVPIVVTVRWHDGYMERFEASEVRAGCDLLWLRQTDGSERNIPLRSVRWFGRSIESHEATP